jgi:membrane-bound metal-dependent hydrolase YbcI (DUF457 family)
MYFFAHLFAGVVIGLVLALVSGRRILFWAAALGSILPDLLDKPIGLIVLRGSVDNGRIYFHSLIAVVAVILIGLALIGIDRYRAARVRDTGTDEGLPDRKPVKPDAGDERPPSGAGPSERSGGKPAMSQGRRVGEPSSREKTASDTSHLPPTIKASLGEGISGGRAARTSAITRDSTTPGGTAEPTPQRTPSVPWEGGTWHPYGSLSRPSRKPPAMAAGSPSTAKPPAQNGTVPVAAQRTPEAQPPRTTPTGTRTGFAGLFLIALALGMLSHQLLDAMWLERVNWFWPFLGRFAPKYYDNFWLLKFWEEVRNPSEWVFAVLAIAVVAILHWKLRGSSHR